MDKSEGAFAIYYDSENRIKGLKNKTVCDKIASDGYDSTANWIHSLSAEPKPTLRCLESFLRRLKDTNKSKKKSKYQEEKKGIAGQVGTYAYWLEENCKLPIGQPKKTSEAVDLTSETLHLKSSNTLGSSSTITRSESLDLREKLALEKTKTIEAEKKCAVAQANLSSIIMRNDYKSTQMKRLRSKDDYQRKKIKKLEMQNICSKEPQEQALQDEIDLIEQLREENLSLKECVKTQEDKIKELTSESLRSLDTNKNAYTTSFREMCYELLKEHVGLSHIGPVITCVLRFANKKVDKLPSEACLRMMNKERLALAQRFHPDMTKRILITGASGLLGRDCIKAFLQDQEWETLGLSFSRTKENLKKVDLTDPQQLSETIRCFKPTVILHSAAERRPDVVEKDPEKTKSLNVTATQLLCDLAKEVGAYVLFISTDYVFDGSSPPYQLSATPNPLNKYGLSKAEGEKIVTQSNPENIVLRVPILYGAIERLDESAVTVLFGSVKDTSKSAPMNHYERRYPTSCADVAKAIKVLIESRNKNPDLTGFFHWSGSEMMTKYDIAMAMAQVFGLPTDHIVADTRPTTGTPRPYDCHLDSSRLEELGATERTPFREGIKAALASFLD